MYIPASLCPILYNSSFYAALCYKIHWQRVSTSNNPTSNNPNYHWKGTEDKSGVW